MITFGLKRAQAHRRRGRRRQLLAGDGMNGSRRSRGALSSRSAQDGLAGIVRSRSHDAVAGWSIRRRTPHRMRPFFTLPFEALLPMY
jgi:hypothetical protein